MPNKAIFLDRDDTLIEDPGYISDPDQVKLLDGVTEALAEFRIMGYKLVIVTNQSAVARGIVTEEVLGKIHDRLEQLLAEGGARLDAIFFCPYHPDGAVRKYRKESNWRKPGPGMILAAAEQIDIDLSQSWTIGNGVRDVEAGRQAGCKTILIDDLTHTRKHRPTEPEPDYYAVNIKEAVNIIKQCERSAAKTNYETPSDSTGDTVAELKDLEEPARSETQEQRMEPEERKNRTEMLLSEILEQLKRTRRTEMFGEFSAMRLVAGIVQVIVLFCLLISVWFLMSPNGQADSVLISLGFAGVFQIMALTFYIMHGQK